MFTWVFVWENGKIYMWALILPFSLLLLHTDLLGEMCVLEVGSILIPGKIRKEKNAINPTSTH